MKRSFRNVCIVLFLPLSFLVGQTGFNAALVDHRNDFADLQYTDVWGYAQPNGQEYALIGTRGGVAIYQLTTNGKLKLLQHAEGDFSRWRDIKSYGDYVYAIDDSGNDGLLIINMKQAPQTITWRFWRPQLTVGDETKFLDNCHNLWIDENGALYLSGCNLNKGGVLIADLSRNPGQPVFAGAADRLYSHDCFARNNRLWSANVYDGSFTVFDVSDKTEPVLLAKQKTGGRFTHNIWLSDDDRYAFTTDEVANAAVEAYDVQDLNNIVRLDSYQPAATLGSGVIPHNVHYYRGWLVISHYTDGVKIVDAHRPGNLVEVGAYDTWPGGDGGYHGCWGAFPFLPSGLILASNIEDGLYVIRPEYRRACYLEGKATDAITGARLNNVRVEILSEQPNVAHTDLNGVYKTGQFPAGAFEVLFVKEGYERTRARAQLRNGEITLLDVQLKPLKTYHLQGRVRDAKSGAIVPNAQITLRNELSFFAAQADEQGAFAIRNVYAESYDVFAAAWGYRYLEIGGLTVDKAGPYELAMTRGYQDDFLFDLGWTTESDEKVVAGRWEWGEPKGTTDSGTAANPYDDLPDDYGDHCYVTGNAGGTATRDDVDGGAVRLLSPPMDLSFYNDPLLAYRLWFFNSLEGGDDTLKVFLSNGREKVLIEQLTDAVSGWRPQSQVRVLDFLPLSAKMQLIVEAADQPDRDHIVEAAFDGFLVLEANATHTPDLLGPELARWRVFPNPANGPVSLEFELAAPARSVEAQVYNSLGQLLYRRALAPASSGRTTLPDLPAPGLYFLRLRIDGRFTPPRKVIWQP